MTEFLSEENIALHKEYLRELSLKYSILEKSIEGIKGIRMSKIPMARCSRDDSIFIKFATPIKLNPLSRKKWLKLANK